MWKKLICGLVLVAFVGLQFAHSLSCYSCNSPQSCLNPNTQLCNNVTANQTGDWLSTIHSDVLLTAGNNNFKCMNLTYFVSANSTKMAEILGCFHQGIPVCSLTLNVSSSWEKSCKTCDYDNCNRNPAGTFSKSTYTMIASVIALVLAKFRAYWSTPLSCKYPLEEVCSDVAANKTSTWLNLMHDNVPEIGHSTKFKCVNMSYAFDSGGVITDEYLGCYHSGIAVCDLRLNISFGSAERFCQSCNSNLCNRNPAGTISRSTYTIIGSSLTLLLVAKLSLTI